METKQVKYYNQFQHYIVFKINFIEFHNSLQNKQCRNVFLMLIDFPHANFTGFYKNKIHTLSHQPKSHGKYPGSKRRRDEKADPFDVIYIVSRDNIDTQYIEMVAVRSKQ